MMENGDAPATKADLAAQEIRIMDSVHTQLVELEVRIGDRVTEIVRDAQTEMLRSFYGFMETIQTRFKAQDDVEAAFQRRLAVLEDRLLEIEKRLNMPPTASL